MPDTAHLRHYDVQVSVCCVIVVPALHQGEEGRPGAAAATL